MEDLDKKISEIVQKMDNEQDSLHQIKQFDDLFKKMGLTQNSDRPTYTYPLVDTIGKDTYSHLNKK